MANPLFAVSLYKFSGLPDVSDMAPAQEQALAAIVFLGMCALVIYWFVQWVMEAPRTVDPWGKEIDEALKRDDAVPVCHRCFTPQQHNGWFCPQCGAIVGPYCNYMPYLYIFSQGEVLRAGVNERIRHSPLIAIGYILFSLGTFAVAAPIYWFFLFRNVYGTGPSRALINIATEEEGPVADRTEGTDVEMVKKCSWCGREYPEEVTVCPIDGHPVVREKKTN